VAARKKPVDFTAVGLPTVDSYANVAAKLGIDQNNLSAGSAYNFNPITRNRLLLEQAYRGSWLVRAAVDNIADDMTRAGVDLTGDIDPGDIEKIETEIRSLQVWTSINRTIRWARLYGGAIAVILLEGQDLSTPLRMQTVGLGQFKGLAVLDRWMLQPSLSDLITDYGPHAGKPKYYDITVTNGPLPPQRVHFSRVIRMEGDDLPFFQKQMENLWGLSVLEPVYDRLVAFDSTTIGAAQLVYKAHLRILKMPGLIKSIAMGAPINNALKARLEMMRLFQSIEGITAIDAEEEFQTNSYNFAGLSDVLLQFAQQLSGAFATPMVRLFGQSPAGLNSTGESDLKNYYDGINGSQETDLRNPVKTILEVTHRSVLGKEPSDTFSFDFTSLWQMSEKEKAEVANVTSDAVSKMVESAVIDHATALKELRQSSDSTGIFTNITDEQIKEAEDEPPMPAFSEQMQPGLGGDEPGMNGAAGAKGDAEGNGLRKGNSGAAKADREAERSRNRDARSIWRDDSEEGVWRTIHGAHVLIKNGEVVEGAEGKIGNLASSKSSSTNSESRNLSHEVRNSQLNNNEKSNHAIATHLMRIAHATNAKSYSKEQRTAIDEYKEAAYEDINANLRGSKISGDRSQETLKRYTDNMDTMIAGSKLSEPVTVFRGININPDLMEEGKTFTDKGFVSTSADDAVPDKFNPKVRMEIRVPKGANAFVYENDTAENEILLPRNSRFKIKSVEDAGGVRHVVAELAASRGGQRQTKDATKKNATQNKYIWHESDIEWD
jgi:phage-related protein (TIGR01555 family)